MSDSGKKAAPFDVFNHPRLSEFNRLVYPVISRRAGGLSLGINLNPSKICSYNCVYCQVDRSVKIKNLKVNLEQITQELDHWIRTVQDPDGTFSDLTLKDISIAGDGEPTLCKSLPELISILCKIKTKYQLTDSKLVLFTNGSNINRSDLLEVLPEFFKQQGEIWYKLDFWDKASYQKINRSAVTYEKILGNLIMIGNRFPLVLQSCFFAWDKQPFSTALYQNYVTLIKQLLEHGVQLKLIQVYTVARKPTESFVSPWSDREMDQLHEYLTASLNVKLSLIYSSGTKEK